jgi:hypothetical protein
MGSAASAGEECSQLYKICNWSCDRTINAVDNFLVCKSQCDRRLIACDRRPINASTPGGRPLRGLTPQGDDRSMADWSGLEFPPARQSSTTGHDMIDGCVGFSTLAVVINPLMIDDRP